MVSAEAREGNGELVRWGHGFGDDPERYVHARSRRGCAGTSPRIGRARGSKKVVMARHIRNDWGIGALPGPAPLNAPVGAHARYGRLRACGLSR